MNRPSPETLLAKSPTIFFAVAAGRRLQAADGIKNLKNVRLARAYKSRDGEWRETPSFRESDIPKAIVALQKAYEYLVMEERQ